MAQPSKTKHATSTCRPVPSSKYTFLAAAKIRTRSLLRGLPNGFPDRRLGLLGPIAGDLAAPLDGFLQRRQVDAIDAELIGGDPLLHPHARRIDRRHHRRNREI